MYQNYIFDLYGTLFDIRTDEGMESLWENMASFYTFNGAAYAPEQLEEKYCEYVAAEKEAVKAKHPKFTKIDIEIKNVFKKLYTDCDVKPSRELVEITARLFRCLSTTMQVKPYDGVFDLFELLHSKGKKIFLLSNAQRSFTEPELRAAGIYDKFDGVLISSDALCCKPDVAFYKKLFTKFDLKKEESIMIGNDATSDIKGANDFGIDSLYIHTEISPQPMPENVDSTYVVEDGNFRKIAQLIVK
ncbi:MULTISPECIES: HAD family hydrolase [unclassified Ruminococcus]|uniref:HAD family hydrolase n=1 Tax=unclassified Ruminococcus TaxID=2608920 RepID=UPI00210E020F|nr:MULTISPECIES: HAD family hydrolase [unclassified Ruminococcus]MCQ4021575.1 HAD-IA family hydrolase [Ruminococcus sp. zg-924]MCQ4114020.1 HAD-IA family hydrolase [Ruminococcus sp. zg-921]